MPRRKRLGRPTLIRSAVATGSGLALVALVCPPAWGQELSPEDRIRESVVPSVVAR